MEGCSSRALVTKPPHLWLVGAMSHVDGIAGELWSAVTGGSERPPEVTVSGESGLLPSTLPVEDVALSCVSVALMAASRALTRRGGGPVACTIDRTDVADSMISERLFSTAGKRAGNGFAGLSTFWRAADGWVRTHANYSWHRDALLSALGVRESVDSGVTRIRVSSAMADLPAQEVEREVFAQGGIAVAVRSRDEWSGTEQGRAVSQEDLVVHRVIPGERSRGPSTATSPMGGVRVLDLTRVIAGPVCTRYLGSLGADVLRLDSAWRPDMSRGEPADTLLGKRSAEVDFSMPSGHDTLHSLLDSADVLVCGYRPGSLDRFGLSDDELAERHPGLVVVRLSAWGHTGPWAMRRGFDSIVQAATGIAACEALLDEPGVLPCQLLDQGTGSLAAAAALDGLHRRDTQGGTQFRTLSLARTAKLLMDSPPSVLSGQSASTQEPERARVTSVHGDVDAVAPPGTIGGIRLRWPSPLSGYLDDEPAWWNFQDSGG